MATSEELLESINNAILFIQGKLEAGAYLELKFGGVALKEYDLEGLYRIRARLIAEVNAGTGTGSPLRLQRMRPGGMT